MIGASTMTKSICQADGCERPHWARGWCTTHLSRWRRHGDVRVNLHDGIESHPSYAIWRAIVQRTTNPSHHAWSRYGGRGISMSPLWVRDSRAFLGWLDENLGPRPEGMTLDRIDNDGNYEPGNLRWASRLAQSENRRSFRGGVTQRGERWMARATIDGVRCNLGTFRTREEAVTVRSRAIEERNA